MRADELRAAGLLSTGEDVSPEELPIGEEFDGNVFLMDDEIMPTKKKEGAKVGWLRMSEVCDLSDCK